jgi:hypothetical protein
MTFLSSTIIDKKVFYISHKDLNNNSYKEQYDEDGWYVEVSFSDGNYDIFGPFKNKVAARNLY